MKALNASLYACRWDAYSVVVACQGQEAAREIFAAWLAETHGVFTNPKHVTFPKRVRSLGERPLLIGGN